MKPRNLDNKPCSPISSNCVIWQGPDIPCIKLCNGDSVSDVVAKLATELCTIMEQTNVSAYDLACLGLGNFGPVDFQGLIQLLVTKICEIENISVSTSNVINSGGTTGSTSGDCPDCVVSVAECFQSSGTTMQLTAYTQLIGERICVLINDISSINATLVSLDTRVTTLENTPPPSSTTPSFTLTCTVGSYTPGTPLPINTILQEFINNVWCNFYAVTGSSGSLTLAISKQCITDSDTQLSDGQPFSSNANWVSPASTVADTITNIWVALCDIYNYTKTFASTVIAGVAIPTGSVMAFAGDVEPVGWKFCDGSTLNRTTYSDLFNVIGTTYGSSNSTNFYLPDLRQRIPVGLGVNTPDYTYDTLGTTGGDETVTLTTNEIPAHTHDVNATLNLTLTGTTDSAGGHSHTAAYTDMTAAPGTGDYRVTDSSQTTASGGGTLTNTEPDHAHDLTGVTADGTLATTTSDGSPTLGGVAHKNMQPYIIMNYIIKL